MGLQFLLEIFCIHIFTYGYIQRVVCEKTFGWGIYREYEREFKMTVLSKSGIRLAKSPLFSGKWVKLNAMDLSRKYSTTFKYYF